MMTDDGLKPVYWDHFAAAEPDDDEWSVETRMLQRMPAHSIDDEQFDSFEVKRRSHLERLQFWRHWNDDDHELVFKQVPYHETELFESVAAANAPRSHLGSLRFWEHNDDDAPPDVDWVPSDEEEMLVAQLASTNDKLYNSFEVRQKSHLARLRQPRDHDDNQARALKNEWMTILPTMATPLSSSTTPAPLDSSVCERPRAARNWLGLALLITSFCAMSTVGVAFQVESSVEVAPMLKLFWRVSGSCMLSFVLTMVSVARYGWPRVHAPLDTAIRVVLCAVGFTLWTSCSNLSSTLTSPTHANVLLHAHGLILVAGNVLTEQYVGRWEGIGTIVGFVGTVIATIADAETVAWSSFWNTARGSTWHANFVALTGAAGAVLYLVQAKAIQARMNFMVFMWCHTVAVCGLLLPTMSLMGETFEFSTNPSVGLFGWATPNRWPLELYLVAVCDFVGSMGYLRVLQFFEPIVVSMTMLLEPTLASFLGAIVSGSQFPGMHVVLGSLLVAAGVVLVYSVKTSHPSSSRRRSRRPTTHSSEFVPRKPLNYGTIVV
ncbi:hypothetical protein H310_00461 [Aphanomyces invadans]|uniref:EamA domain-containing protein n=1 Tax=Aphanomyces invadans TaxID=157072 RepID=A0A024UVU2_9STRA|nr:hypothetical protein H310_00461 [Aphanomyces invadans]ETW10075.1 hypothetical protein H310_00461 [Aphanomyces invadans]|eukprot:XP_008861486.1 hypothetical protein H310_00461 [Aphanomyces invadans]